MSFRSTKTHTHTHLIVGIISVLFSPFGSLTFRLMPSFHQNIYFGCKRNPCKRTVCVNIEQKFRCRCCCCWCCYSTNSTRLSAAFVSKLNILITLCCLTYELNDDKSYPNTCLSNSNAVDSNRIYAHTNSALVCNGLHALNSNKSKKDWTEVCWRKKSHMPVETHRKSSFGIVIKSQFQYFSKRYGLKIHRKFYNEENSRAKQLNLFEQSRNANVRSNWLITHIIISIITFIHIECTQWIVTPNQ